MKENILGDEKFKYVAIFILIAIIFIGYQQYASSAYATCEKSNAELNKQVRQDISGSNSILISSDYKFKNNTCYSYIAYNEPTEYHYFIENPITKEVVATCAIYRNSAQPVIKDSCDQYFQKYGEIFK